MTGLVLSSIVEKTRLPQLRLSAGIVALRVGRSEISETFRFQGNKISLKSDANLGPLIFSHARDRVCRTLLASLGDGKQLRQITNCFFSFVASARSAASCCAPSLSARGLAFKSAGTSPIGSMIISVRTRDLS